MSLKAKIRSIVFKLNHETATEELIKSGLKIGENFHRQEKTIIDSSHCWLITIGNNVTLAPRVHVLAHDASTKNALGYTRIGLVNIGNNVFVGAGTIILPGVSVGDNVVIGSGSVVTKDIPSNSVAVGNPAKVISSYESYISKKHSELSECPLFDDTYTLRNPNLTDEIKNKMISDLSKGRIGYVK